jgi:LacI family transcriptional regulator
MSPNTKRPTLADVAKLAGVSLGTASRALSVPQRLKPATLKKVNEVVAELGYMRNGAARALASRKTRTIGAVFPTIDNPVYANAINSLQRASWALGYQLLIASHEYDSVQESDVTRTLMERGIDGVILVGTDHEVGVYNLIRQHGLPYVLIWSLDETNYPHCIGFSNHTAAYNMARRVLGHGHKKIAICGGSSRHNERSRARVAGTLAALAEAGLSIPARWTIEEPFSFEGGRRALRKLWAGKSRPTALICGTDIQAIGALHECQALGIDVPGDLSITGFDDIEYAGVTTPPLTTVHVPTDQIGVRAAERIVALIEGKGPDAEEPLVANVVERGSLGPARDRP